MADITGNLPFLVVTAVVGCWRKNVTDNVFRASSKVSQVFWSCGNVAKNAARQVAKKIGGNTLETARLGQYLEQKKASNSAWQATSSNFANVVEIQVVQYIRFKMHQA